MLKSPLMAGERTESALKKIQIGVDQARFRVAKLFPYPWDGYLGLNFETPGHSPIHYFSTVVPLEIFLTLSQAEFRGQRAPKEGPAIFAGSHNKELDMWLMQTIPFREGRTMSSFARNTLRDQNAPEADLIKKRRQDGLSGRNKEWYMKLFGPYIEGFGCYWIDLGIVDSKATRSGTIRAIRDLKNGKLVGVFPQGTRRPPYDFLDVLDGVARIAKITPEVPIYPVGFNYESIPGRILPKPVVVVGEPFSYKEVPKLEAENEVEDVTNYLADRIAELVFDPKLKLAWSLNRHFGLTRQQIESVLPQHKELTAGEIFSRFFGNRI